MSFPVHRRMTGFRIYCMMPATNTRSISTRYCALHSTLGCGCAMSSTFSAPQQDADFGIRFGQAPPKFWQFRLVSSHLLLEMVHFRSASFSARMTTPGFKKKYSGAQRGRFASMPFTCIDTRFAWRNHCDTQPFVLRLSLRVSFRASWKVNATVRLC